MDFDAEVKCFFCKAPADRIIYYRKVYYDGKTTIENPQVSCGPCFLTHQDSFHQNRGGTEEVTYLLFSTLSQLPKFRLGLLFSMKGKEINHLKSPYWKNIIWRMYYLHLPQKGGK